jgi:microcystin-dependent protein
VGWAQCNGQLLSIAQFTALFSLCGTYYGGNGTTTFGLPNLQGAIPMFWGQGAGLSNYVIGEQSGETTVTLLSTEMPQHNHTVQDAQSPTLRTGNPGGSNWLGVATGADCYLGGGATPNTQLNPAAMAVTGGSQPHENMQPYLAIEFCIAMVGIYPARN